MPPFVIPPLGSAVQVPSGPSRNPPTRFPAPPAEPFMYGRRQLGKAARATGGRLGRGETLGAGLCARPADAVLATDAVVAAGV